MVSWKESSHGVLRSRDGENDGGVATERGDFPFCSCILTPFPSLLLSYHYLFRLQNLG